MSGSTYLLDGITDRPITDVQKTIIEEVSPTLIYEGRCQILNASTNDKEWQLRRIRYVGKEKIIEYAGKGQYDHKWIDRVEEFSMLDFEKELSLELDGINERVHLDTNFNLTGYEKRSFSVWVKPKKMNNSTIFHKGKKSGYYTNEYYLDLDNFKLRFCMARDKGEMFECKTKNESIKKSQWNHVVITYDGTLKGSAVKIYVNGEEQKTEVYHDRMNKPIEPGGDFHIGAKTDIDYFRGKITEFCVFNDILSEDEIKEIYNNGEPREMLHIQAKDSLIHWYRLGDGDTVTRIMDQIGKIHGRPQNLEANDYQRDIPKAR